MRVSNQTNAPLRIDLQQLYLLIEIPHYGVICSYSFAHECSTRSAVTGVQPKRKFSQLENVAAIHPHTQTLIIEYNARRMQNFSDISDGIEYVKYCIRILYLYLNYVSPDLCS